MEKRYIRNFCVYYNYAQLLRMCVAKLVVSVRVICVIWSDDDRIHESTRFAFVLFKTDHVPFTTDGGDVYGQTDARLSACLPDRDNLPFCYVGMLTAQR